MVSHPYTKDGIGRIKFGEAVLDVGCIEGTDHMMKSDTKLLLGAKACSMLGLVSAPLSDTGTPTHMLQELECLADIRLLETLLGKIDTDGAILEQSTEDESDNVTMDSEATAATDSIKSVSAMLAETVVGDIIDKMNGNPFPEDEFSIDEVKFAVNLGDKPYLEPGGVLTLDEAEKLRSIVLKHRAAFATSKFPKPTKRDPVQVKLKPTSQWPRKKPVHVPKPRFKPQERIALNCFRERGVRNGQLVPAPHSQWATYCHLVAKRNSKNEIVALRPTENDKPLNACVVPEPYEMPNGPHQLKGASTPATFVMSTDVNAAFNGFRIHEDSQQYFVIWLPTGAGRNDGAAEFANTRLGFGYRNSPSIMMDYYDTMMNDFDEKTRQLVNCFYDDWVLRSPKSRDRKSDFEAFCEALADFLSTLITYQVELSPRKTVFGRLVNTFYGFTFDSTGRSSLAEHNVKAIRALPQPTGVTALKSALGMFTQYRDFVPNFSDISAPLHELTSNETRSKKWEEVWTSKPREAFERLKAALANTTSNFAPNFEHPFSVEADASDLAIGGRIFQKIDNEEYNIAYFSRSLTPAERRLPVYFRELVAMIEGIKRARIYAHSSTYSLIVYTDQKSLKFTAQVSKGALSAHHLAEVLDVDFKVEYVKGTRNKADFWSRYGYTRPDSPLREGLDEAAFVLTRALGPDTISAWTKIWVHAGKDTPAFKALLKRSRLDSAARLSFVPGSPTSGKDFPTGQDFSILVPEALHAPEICAKLLVDNKPAAVLIPTDVLRAVALNHDGSFNQHTHSRLLESAKICLAANNQCWVMVNTPSVQTAIVCLADAVDDLWGDNEREQGEDVAQKHWLEGFGLADDVPTCGVSKDAGPDTAGSDFEQLTTAELKQRLLLLEKSQNGNRATLIRRLRDAIAASRPSGTPPDVVFSTTLGRRQECQNTSFTNSQPRLATHLNG